MKDIMTISSAPPLLSSGPDIRYQQLVSEIEFVIHRFDPEIEQLPIGYTYLFDTDNYHYQITFCDLVRLIQLIKIPYVEQDGDIDLDEESVTEMLLENFRQFILEIV